MFYVSRPGYFSDTVCICISHRFVCEELYVIRLNMTVISLFFANNHWFSLTWVNLGENEFNILRSKFWNTDPSLKDFLS